MIGVTLVTCTVSSSFALSLAVPTARSRLSLNVSCCSLCTARLLTTHDVELHRIIDY
jgi:hypothetical protein